jgi:hypothetical protein
MKLLDFSSYGTIQFFILSKEVWYVIEAPAGR